MKSFFQDLPSAANKVLLGGALLSLLLHGVPLVWKDMPEAARNALDSSQSLAPKLPLGAGIVSALTHLRSIQRVLPFLTAVLVLAALSILHYLGMEDPNAVTHLAALGTTLLTAAFPFVLLYALPRRGPDIMGGLPILMVVMGVAAALAWWHPGPAGRLLATGFRIDPMGVYAPAATALVGALVPLALSRKYGITLAAACLAAGLLPPVPADVLRLALCVLAASA